MRMKLCFNNNNNNNNNNSNNNRLLNLIQELVLKFI